MAAKNDASHDPRVLDKNMATTAAGTDVQWTDIEALSVEGRGFVDTAALYDRLPARAEGAVPIKVWNLSRDSTGMAVRFVTDAASISVRWTLRFEPMAMPHMPASGVSGLDLYARDGQRWCFVGMARPEQFPTNEVMVAKSLVPVAREYILYLPLYNGVESVAVGVPAGATMEPAPPRPAERAKPICFYGTSITQGGCASRPGMAYAAIVGRWLDRPTINLGFSGNGKMELELADLLGEMDVSVHVLDSLGNLEADGVAERLEPFYCRLREHQPTTPVVLMEETRYGLAEFMPPAKLHDPRNDILRELYERYLPRDKNLYYVSGADLLGDDGEGTVDGCHPTDLGFLRMAEVLAPVLRELG